MSRPYEGPLVLWVSLAIMSAIALAIMLSGCGASERQSAHSALNLVTDVADPSYELAVRTCDEAEWVIVRREGSSQAEDLSAMATVREICDGVFAGFEGLRIAQREARELVDAEERGDVIGAAMETLGRLWRALQELVPELETLGGEM